MNQSLSTIHEQLTRRTSRERRRQTRYPDHCPVKLRGLSADGSPFDIETKLENHSGGGCYIRLTEHCVVIGARLFAVIEFSACEPPVGTPPLVAVNGVVVRTELHPEGGCGVALKFSNYRFLGNDVSGERRATLPG